MKSLHRLLLCVLPLCLGLTGQAQDQPRQEHVGRVLDWSYHHVILSGGLPGADLDRARVEPRVLFHLAERNSPFPAVAGRRGTGRDRGDRRPGLPFRPQKGGLKIDWSVPLGAGNVAPNMFPAKYSFDINATPSCPNDFVVFGLNVAGVSTGQANLVGLRNLYSGTAPAGLCAGAAATFYWAYNGSTAGGSVLTSPVLSLDGTKVAYVESAAGSTVFHVLTWLSGQGTSATASAAPTLNGSCVAGTTSCLKSVTLSATATDTLSSPWVDYQTDKAFVGTDDGKIYRISCVFTCGIGNNPVVDWTFTLPVAGTGGAAATPNGPVYDFPSGRLFVGDQLGELWVINAGTATPTLNAGPVMIGGGGCSTTNPPGRTGTPAPCTANGGSFGIPDSVMMDSAGGSQRIFAFSGNDGTAGASAVVAQLKFDLTGLVRVHVGLGSVGTTIANWNIHTGAFDDAYFGATPSSGHLFLCGTGAANTQPTHYWIGFAGYPTMDAAPAGSLLRTAVADLPCAPYTELFNPTITLKGGAGHHDLLVSGLVGAAGNGFVITNDISTGAIITGQSTSVNYPGGVSGIIVDNVSSAAQASSVYFTTQGALTATVGTCSVGTRCAVKLTQLNLQ